jgi:hypothetical protein
MSIFLVIVAIIVVVIVVVKINKHNKDVKAIEQLKRSPCYKIMENIKSQLESRGYDPGSGSSITTIAVNGEASSSIYVWSGSGPKELLGEVICYDSRNSLEYACSRIQYKNINKKPYEKVLGGHYYAVANPNVGIIATSNKLSAEIPPFLEIVADVLRNCDYQFEHPKCYYEDPNVKKYLNVMFK